MLFQTLISPFCDLWPLPAACHQVLTPQAAVKVAHVQMDNHEVVMQHAAAGVMKLIHSPSN